MDNNFSDVDGLTEEELNEMLLPPEGSAERQTLDKCAEILLNACGGINNVKNTEAN